MSKIDHTLGAGLGIIFSVGNRDGPLVQNTRQTSDVECKQGPIFENRRSIYMTGIMRIGATQTVA